MKYKSINKKKDEIIATICDEGKGLVRLFSELFIEKNNDVDNDEVRDLYDTGKLLKYIWQVSNTLRPKHAL